jgi:hypothetical protein
VNGWSAELTRQWVCVASCIGIAVSSLEWLVPSYKLERWHSLNPGLTAPPGRLGPRGSWRWQTATLRLLLVARLLVSVGFVGVEALGWSPAAARALLLLVGLSSLPLRCDEPIGVSTGMDGAERLLAVCVLVLGVTFLLDSRWTLQLALGFVAAQALLEYVSAGWTKAMDLDGWARGTHLARVIASSNYGHRGLAPWVLRNQRLVGKLSLVLITLEVAAPGVLLAPRPWAEMLVMALLAFHIGCAVVMGLSTFVWAFGATYPAMLYWRDLISTLFN